MKKLAVLGHPVHHSLSPQLFAYWGKKYGIQLSYEAIEISPGDFSNKLRELALLGYSGFNITMPHKEKTIRLVDSQTENAQRVGAINTVTVDENYKFEGENTDFIGIKSLLQEAKINNKIAVVLGAGGASRATCYALKDLGFRLVYVVNRTYSNVHATCKILGRGFFPITWDERNSVLYDADLLVNSTSLGLKSEIIEIDFSLLNKGAVVVDFVCKKGGTQFLDAARAHGHKVIDGVEILVRQAQPCFKNWFGIVPEFNHELYQILIAND